MQLDRSPPVGAHAIMDAFEVETEPGSMDELAASIELLPKRTLLRANGPLYRQLADVLREPISSGQFPVGGELPKEASIAEHFGVSLITVRQALRDLETDGLIR